MSVKAGEHLTERVQCLHRRMRQQPQILPLIVEPIKVFELPGYETLGQSFTLRG